MNTWVWIVIGVVVAIVVLGVLFSALRTRRSRSLQDQFGREYDRTVDKAGGRREAERELAERQKRHDELELKPLPPEARERYLQQWQQTQSRFVDDPTGAVSEADDLVNRVMRDRGYPVDDFEQRAADISVEHPELVERYRTANGIARASEQGKASTEDLRHSVRHYRALFVELLDADAGDGAEHVDEVSTHGAEADGDARTSNRVERLR
jgi:FtsZ-interacting cell division protein ZipA